MKTLLLENEWIQLAFDSTDGRLVGVRSQKTGWELIENPSLGLSFRLLVPCPAKRNTQVLGEKQKLSNLRFTENEIAMEWKELVTEEGNCLPICVRACVCLKGELAEFRMEIENHSEYMVENAYYPYLGDIHHPKDAEWFKTFLTSYSSTQELDLWPHYQNMLGYFGVDYPTQMMDGSMHAPFILLRDQCQGLYVGAAAPEPDPIFWMTELRPGYSESMDSHVPESDEMGGIPVCTRFAAVQFPYIQPGETRSLVPVAVGAYQGSWHRGVDVYRRWKEPWFQPAVPPKWVQEVHSWQQIHINSPEDELRMKFKELPKIGEDCASRGVKAIQLVGWNDGGQDQGNPSHDPDPRLGTAEELKEAIAQIQRMGVKVILFTKFTWADRATEWFRRDLKRLAVKDPYGDYYMHPGYRYQTATQLADINVKRLIPMCFCEEYLDICCREFQKIVDLGADGILNDEGFHHGPAYLCFDESHGHRYGAPVYTNDRELIRRFREMLPAEKREDYLFSCEACYDWEMDSYTLSYFRTEGYHHVPVYHYMQPGGRYMTAITGFNDRDMLNQCLMYQYVVSYEPYNFKGRLEDYPQTMDYGAKMDDLRRENCEYLWDGEFCDESGAYVEKDGQRHHPYSVFRNRRTGRKCVVAANYGDSPAVFQVYTDEEKAPARFRTVETEWKNYSGSALLPPHSAGVFLFE